MPLKPNNFRADTYSLNDDYYRNQFTTRSMELSKNLEINPNDLVAKEQLEYINEVLRRGDENNKAGEPFDWSVAWQNWESNILPNIKHKHMNTKVKNEDLKFVPINTRCAKCYKIISQGILQDGINIGNVFNCKECYLKDKNGN